MTEGTTVGSFVVIGEKLGETVGLLVVGFIVGPAVGLVEGTGDS